MSLRVDFFFHPHYTECMRAFLSFVTGKGHGGLYEAPAMEESGLDRIIHNIGCDDVAEGEDDDDDINDDDSNDYYDMTRIFMMTMMMMMMMMMVMMTMMIMMMVTTVLK